MKKIKYLCGVRVSTEDYETEVQSSYWIETTCADADFEANYAIAQQEAVGEVTVEDVPDSVTEPTQLDRVEAQAAYTAMLTDTLLEV